MKISHLNIIITSSLIYFAGLPEINAKPPYRCLFEGGIRSGFSTHYRGMYVRHFASSRPTMLKEKDYNLPSKQKLRNTSGPSLKGIVFRLYSTVAENSVVTDQNNKPTHTSRSLGNILRKRERELQLDTLNGEEWNKRFFELVDTGEIKLLKPDKKPLDSTENLSKAIEYIKANCSTSINTLGGEIEDSLGQPLENVCSAYRALLSYKKEDLLELARNHSFRESFDQVFWDFEEAFRTLNIMGRLSSVAKNELLLIRQNYVAFKHIGLNFLYSVSSNKTNEKQ